jgi:uncharacterized protein YbcI
MAGRARWDTRSIEAAEQPEARALPVIAAISREIVGIHAAHFGRGPTGAKTVWREDVVVCVLRDVFTRSERVLVEAGKFEQVRSNRQLLQEAVEPLLRQAVEGATGCPVQVLLSQVAADGTACEVFLLDR